MKYASLALNGVLTLAVAFLFYLFYSSKSVSNEVPANQTIAPQEKQIDTTSQEPVYISDPSASNVVIPQNAKIVFVNSEKMLENFSLYKKMMTDLESKKNRVESSLAKKAQDLQNEYMAIQPKLSSMSKEELQSTEQLFMGKQQELMKLRDDELKKMVDEEGKNTKRIFDEINTFMKSFCKQNNYDYVLGYTNGAGGILYANPEFDITSQVIVGLNKAGSK